MIPLLSLKHMCPACRPPTHCTQYGACLALVELKPGDERLWRQRLERRGRQHAGTEHAHKPGSWDEVQAMLARNSDSERWSLEQLDIPLRCQVDSTASTTEQQLEAVCGMLRAAGVSIGVGSHAAAAERPVGAAGGTKRMYAL